MTESTELKSHVGKEKATMDWLDKRELHAGFNAPRTQVSRAPSVISATPSLGVGAVKLQRQRLVELKEKRAELTKKRKERESYLLYLRSLFAASSTQSSRQSTASTAGGSRRVVHVDLGETWNLIEQTERELERSLQQLDHK